MGLTLLRWLESAADSLEMPQCPRSFGSLVLTGEVRGVPFPKIVLAPMHSIIRKQADKARYGDKTHLKLQYLKYS